MVTNSITAVHSRGLKGGMPLWLKVHFTLNTRNSLYGMMRMATHVITNNRPVVCAAALMNSHDWLINIIGGRHVERTTAPYQLNAL